jgi:hypothetical protein
MARDCPRCGLTNPTEAQRCDCGYDFIARKVRASFLTNKQRIQIAKEAEAAEPALDHLQRFGDRPPYVFLVLAFVEVLGTLAAKAIEKLKRSR